MQHTQEAIDKSIKELTNDDVIRFFNEKVKNSACPICYENKWSFVGGPEHTLGLVALLKNGTFQLPPPTVAVSSIACTNCGYIRTHALGVVANWKLNGG